MATRSGNLKVSFVGGNFEGTARGGRSTTAKNAHVAGTEISAQTSSFRIPELQNNEE